MLGILIADKLASEGLSLIERTADVKAAVKTGLTEDELASIVGQYDGMVIRSGVKVTAKVLAEPGRLRAIARAGVGVDNVDLAAATQAGILVMNTPDANTISTAEHTMALLMALSRKVVVADAHVRGGAWERGRFVGTQLAGRTIGVIGLGRVGRTVAARMLAMGMRVLGFDPFYSGQTALDGKVRMVEQLHDLLVESDVVTLHTPKTPDTAGLIGAEELRIMKRSALLINCARGGLIDEDALCEALTRGQIAGAALDVYTTEPPADSPLLELPNVVLTPTSAHPPPRPRPPSASTPSRPCSITCSVTRSARPSTWPGSPVNSATATAPTATSDAGWAPSFRPSAGPVSSPSPSTAEASDCRTSVP